MGSADGRPTEACGPGRGRPRAWVAGRGSRDRVGSIPGPSLHLQPCDPGGHSGCYSLERGRRRWLGVSKRDGMI